MIFMPVTGNNLNTGEPNNNCSEAVPLTLNHIHRFLADDANDWYLFDLTAATPVIVRLTDFQVDGQIIVWKEENCSDLDNSDFVASNGNNNSTKVLNLGVRTAGRYFIWIINDDAPTYVPYHLEVETN
jgi:hypothetical protein